MESISVKKIEAIFVNLCLQKKSFGVKTCNSSYGRAGLDIHTPTVNKL